MSRRPSVRFGADLYWSGSEAAFHAVTELLAAGLPASAQELRAETEAAASFGWLAPADLPEPQRSTLLHALVRAAAEGRRTEGQQPETAAELALLGRLAEQALATGEGEAS